MMQLLTVIFYQPLLNLLVLAYNLIPGHDLGLAIIAVTILIKLVLYPFSLKSIQSQKAMQELQPKLDALKLKFKDDKEAQAKEMMLLYKNEKVSPFSSCLPLLIQLPFLIAIYQVFRTGLSNGSLGLVYPFIANPGHINPIAFGFLDLSKPQWVLALLAAVIQFWQAKMLVNKKPEVPGYKNAAIFNPQGIPTPGLIANSGAKDENMMAMMNKQMTYLMPAMTLIIGFSLPGGLALYWVAMTLVMVAQQYLAFNFHNKKQTVEVIDKAPTANNPQIK
jgi:YidC/Oxa1 family membrane protein insertase